MRGEVAILVVVRVGIVEVIKGWDIGITGMSSSLDI